MGQFDEAISRTSYQYPLSDDDVLEARGLARLAAGKYAEAEQDLSAALLIDPRDIYRAIFHHLAATLANRSEWSRLKSEIDRERYTEDSWPLMVARFLTDTATEEVLLGAVAESADATSDVRETESFFYRAVAARFRNDSTSERALLQECVEQNMPTTTEFWLAVHRLHQIDK